MQHREYKPLIIIYITMSQVYLRDLKDDIKQEFIRDIVKNREGEFTIEQLEEGNISIGEYHAKSSDYELI